MAHECISKALVYDLSILALAFSRKINDLQTPNLGHLMISQDK